MKTQYKFIHFEQHELAPDNWICRNNKSKGVLGFVTYYAPWWQWVFVPQADIVLSDSCMMDIVDFLKQLKEK